MPINIVFVAALLMIALALSVMFTVIRDNQAQHQFNTIDVIMIQRCVIFSSTYQEFDGCVSERASPRVGK
jgi:hypothetical protein